MKFSLFSKYKNKAGFTLIELLVVVAIIGVLASIVLASLEDARLTARDSASLQGAKQLMTALEMYRNDHGGLYPCANAGCNADATVYLNPLSPRPEDANFISAISPYYKPLRINGSPYINGSLFYRIGGAAPANGGTPNRQEYTISVRLESIDTSPNFCSINMGRGNLMFNGLVDGVSFDNGNPSYYPSCF